MFRFPLQTLLELRRREEDAARQAVAALERERQSLEEDLRRRQRERTEGRRDLREALVGSIDPAALRRDAASTMAVERLARGTVLRLAGLLRRIESERTLLIEATHRRRAVELLRERRLEEWTRERGRRETALLDEIGARIAARGDRSECDA